jgi:hypothetical protein
MDIVTLVNCCFGWFLVILAITGYILTYKRIGEKWIFWNVLATGWAFFALAQTLLLTGVQPGTVYLIGIWLSSFIIVITSLVMMFLKLTGTKTKA